MEHLNVSPTTNIVAKRILEAKKKKLFWHVHHISVRCFTCFTILHMSKIFLCGAFLKPKSSISSSDFPWKIHHPASLGYHMVPPAIWKAPCRWFYINNYQQWLTMIHHYYSLLIYIFSVYCSDHFVYSPYIYIHIYIYIYTYIYIPICFYHISSYLYVFLPRVSTTSLPCFLHLAPCSTSTDRR